MTGPNEERVSESDLTAGAFLHELRGPLALFESEAQAAVAHALKALQRQNKDDAAYRAVAEECLSRLRRMSTCRDQIRHVLDLALMRARADPLELRRSQVGLADLIADAARLSSPGPPVTVAIEPHTLAPPMIGCDPRLLAVALKLSMQAFDLDGRRGPPVSIRWTQLEDCVQLRLVS
jgi:signal transduction histidine kinase